MSDSMSGEELPGKVDFPENEEVKLKQVFREAVLTHARMGRSVVGSENGKVRIYTPEEVFQLFGVIPDLNSPGFVPINQG